MNIDKFTITSYDQITGFDRTNGSLDMILDELSDFKLSQEEEKTDITGKAGQTISSLKKNKKVTGSGTNGMLSGGALAAMLGAEIEDGDGKGIKQAVSLAPVSVAIEADAPIFQHYTSGVIDSSECGASLNHGVLAVGYTADYWIVKNSWGIEWGEEGYVRIQYTPTGSGICGINLMASYPVWCFVCLKETLQLLPGLTK